MSDEERDVDEYNRRYTSVDVEEPYDEDSDGEILAEYNDDMDNEKTVASDSKKERRSDTEYTERIIRYHSPSKITIAGADQVDLYLSDGYYAYGYDTDYSNGSTNVSVNVRGSKSDVEEGRTGHPCKSRRNRHAPLPETTIEHDARSGTIRPLYQTNQVQRRKIRQYPAGDQSAKSGYPVGNDTRAMEPDAYRHLLQ